MENKLLLPNKFKKLGCYMLIPAAITGLVLSFKSFEPKWLKVTVFAIVDAWPFGSVTWFSFIKDNILDEIVSLMFLVGGLLVVFSKEKSEDEFISKLRLSSLLWAVCVNYSLLILAILFFYGTSFFTVMVYNIFTVLIFFIIRFHYMLYKSSKTMPDEKQYKSGARYS